MSYCITKIKGYSFTGEFDGELTTEQLAELGLDAQPEKVPLIEGDFSIDWDDDIAQPMIDTMYLINPYDDKKFITLDLDSVDTATLEEHLAQYGDSADWESDRIAERADWAYDSWKDRMMEDGGE
jgi:hypothetical protein